MKKLAILMMIGMVAAGEVFAKDNLAILPFTGGVDGEGETIAELFSFEPELTTVFNPLPRTSINRAIRNEQRFQMEGGMTDPDTAAELGRQLGARYVVSGSIAALGRQKLLVIAIMQVDDLRQIAGDVETYRNIEEIQYKLPAMARNIAAALKQDAPVLTRLALPPVELLGGADKRDADTLAQILAVDLIKGGKYAVYPRTESLARIQEEYANQFSGGTADEYLPELGKGTNPELVLSVSARKLGSRNMFNAAVINLVTGVQEAGSSANYRTLDEGIAAMSDLAAVLGGGPAPVREVRDREWKAADKESFNRAVAAINARGSGSYTITLTGSFRSDPVLFSYDAYKDDAYKTVTLQGDGRERVISSKTKKPLFTVPETLTLVLDNNLTLNGNKKKAALVLIAGGELVMNAGSTLRGSRDSGVAVSGDGSFTMNGGTISGNSGKNGYGDGGGVCVYRGGSFTMNDGTISGNSGKSGGGGGVCVYRGGSFTMIGGAISNNSAKWLSGGVYIDGGSFTMSDGAISGNSRSGVGVYGGGSFTMNGGTISSHKAFSVYLSDKDSSFVKTGGGIDTKIKVSEGMVYVGPGYF
jgi:TolB-like protein